MFEAFFQIEQRFFVFGKDQQSLVIAKPSVNEKVLLNPLYESFGLGVGTFRKSSELAFVFNGYPVVPHGFEGSADIVPKLIRGSTVLAKPLSTVLGSVVFKHASFFITLQLIVCPLSGDLSELKQTVMIFFRFIRLRFDVSPPSSSKCQRTGKQSLCQK